MNGAISPNTPQTIALGSTTSFTISPDAGYEASVGGTCGGTLSGATYTTNAVAENCTVSATFEAIQTVCPSTDYTLATQAEVDALGATGCYAISGRLSISGTDITSLSSLSGITSVGGDLNIGYNAALTNLNGLSGITGSVGGNLSISGNPALTNLDGLSGITSIGGSLYIGENVALTNLDGLSGLTSVGGPLTIQYNAALTNLDGLAGITSVGGNLSINENVALTNLDGLSGITSVGGDLSIRSNSNLGDCIGITPLLGWPDGPPDDLVVGAIAVQSNSSGCNSVEEILASVTGPTQPVITEVSTGNGYAALTFTPATAAETLFPITGYEAACLGGEVTNATSPAVDILDNSDPVESSLTISGAGSAANSNEIEVDIDISHARPQRLMIQLTSPQGTTLTLWDESAQTTTDIVGTFPTTLTPLDSIDSVTGEEINGTWVLSVQDVNAIGGYEGVLNSWGLRIKEKAKATGSSPITVTGLTNNRDYACTVAPITKLGVFPVSAAVTATPSPELPATPLITSVAEDDAGLVVRFTLANDGGAPITDYTVTCGGVSASGVGSPIRITGLTNGQAYSCTVTATSSVGTSSASSAVSGTPEEFTPSGLPIWLLLEATK